MAVSHNLEIAGVLNPTVLERWEVRQLLVFPDFWVQIPALPIFKFSGEK